MRDKINIEDYVYYDETSPSCLRWKVDIHSGAGSLTRKMTIAGEPILNKSTQGYYQFKIRGKLFKAHRTVWELFNGATSLQIDHIDGVKTNNLLCNIRPVDNLTNCQNKGMYSSNSTGKNGINCYQHGATKTTYITAQWKDVNGKGCAKHYSVKRYGIMVAHLLAATTRDLAIDESNKKGSSYTGRHGK